MSKAVVIASGDPAGCGPILIVRALNKLSCTRTRYYVVGNSLVYRRIPGFSSVSKKIIFVDVYFRGAQQLTPGKISPCAGKASVVFLREALRVMEKERIRALVTAPVSKEAIQLHDRSFSGHTEFLANYFGVSDYAMMMFARRIKIVLATRHIPLREVSAQLSKINLKEQLFVVYSFLQKACKIKIPRIAIASVNPHAGVRTFLGEEERYLEAVIKKLPFPVQGPFPADTLFLPPCLASYDCIVCLYHDQGMIPFKLLAFTQGVNCTIGLPIIRTSPAHGVAFNLMNKQRELNESSMCAAIKLAGKLSGNE